ncbi:MAG: hypothetical protein ABT940_00445 [Alphaproteobacteria bacterium]
MAELLLRVASSLHADPLIDRGCYKRGDVVAVLPDGHVYGRLETLPTFVKVKIPGLAVATAQNWVRPEMDLTDPLKPVMLKRRLWRVRVDDIPAAIRNTLITTGEVTVTLTQVRSYIQNKTTLETA